MTNFQPKPVILCNHIVCPAPQVYPATTMPTAPDKKQLHDAIVTALQALVENARIAVRTAYDAATHEESIAENKYDTLGLEASYLTQGQARRLAECEADLAAFQNIPVRHFSLDDPIAIGALVQVEGDSGQRQTLFLGPAAGGLKIEWDGSDILVITPLAPLGRALLNTSVGDQVTVQMAGARRQYEVLAVF